MIIIYCECYDEPQERVATATEEKIAYIVWARGTDCSDIFMLLD